MSIYEQIKNQVKDIDTSNLRDDIIHLAETNFLVKQKVYVWIRIYIKDEEPNIEIGDDITINYIESGESLKLKFVSYGKSNLNKDTEDEITHYDVYDDKRVLCTMVDIEVINYSEGIPFIRTLFKAGHHYEEQLVKRDELLFIIDKNDVVLDYFEVDF
jgi:hypothetical protein